eukprot:404606-Rhodomonas_salina.2
MMEHGHGSYFPASSLDPYTRLLVRALAGRHSIGLFSAQVRPTRDELHALPWLTSLRQASLADLVTKARQSL